MRHLIDIRDLTHEEILSLLDLADDIFAHPDDYREVCRYKKLATLFFEPSTRTRLSFEAGMMELGGKVLGFSEAASSSASKGESVADTVRVVGCYADIIAMRHPKEGAPLAAAMHSTVSIINAGDGGHNHPTQTLTDLMTIRREKGALGNFTVGLCGDLKFGRTVHSLIAALLRCEGVNFVCISPEELRLPGYVRQNMPDGCVREERDLAAVLPELDVLYMTRVQRERFFNEEDYLQDCQDRAASACSSFQYTNTGFTAQLDSDKEQLIFFSVPYEAGWSATVNGEPAAIERVNVGFMAVVVP